MTPKRTKGIVGQLTKQCSHAEPGAAPDPARISASGSSQLTYAGRAGELDRSAREAKMARRLFVVEDSFLIKGRGLVPVPGIIPRRGERFRVDDPILLKRPDGSTLEWQIGGLELIHTAVPREDVVVLLKGLGKEEVPIGTEVWSVDRAERGAAAAGGRDPGSA
jgi:hypothetical protein